jgi:hypothetical protein
VKLEGGKRWGNKNEICGFKCFRDNKNFVVGRGGNGLERAFSKV